MDMVGAAIATGAVAAGTQRPAAAARVAARTRHGLDTDGPPFPACAGARRRAGSPAPSRAPARARVMSGWRTCGSSTGSASNTISLLEPVTCRTAWASSSIVNSPGLPMFTGTCSLALGEQDEAADEVVDVAEAPGLRAVAEHGQRLARERLADEGRDRPAVVRAHPRAVRVEDADDRACRRPAGRGTPSSAPRRSASPRRTRRAARSGSRGPSSVSGCGCTCGSP